MRINIQFKDRVGIAHEILAVLAKRGLNVVAVEVDPPHIYIDSPELLEYMLPDLQEDCRKVKGVGNIQVLDVLPGSGRIMIANAAAAAVAGTDDATLCSLTLSQILDDPEIERELIDAGFRLPSREVTLKGEPFFMEVTPVSEPLILELAPSGRSVGAVLSFHTPARIGGRLHALQNSAGNGFELIIGESEQIRSLKIKAARVAVVDAPLLITGETGTGKELLAQACHGMSPRANAPFLELNCAALPESLAESELFGYMSGAFTGAQRGGKPGLFEMADGGTVFLDEIGEMSLYLQAKLLRFLNDGKFRRIGGDKEIKVNVRIISATHRNLRKMVQEGLFREDLFYRLNVLHLE